MPDLLAFQEEFADLLAGRLVPHEPELRRAVAVHRNTAVRAACDALAANYSVTREIVGTDPFEACACAFVERYPPSDPRLCLYGAAFATFAGNWPPFRELPYLSALSELERLITESLFDVDATPLDAAAVAGDPDPGMPLKLHPATRVRQFAWPVVSLWRAHRSNAIQMLELVTWQPEAALVTRVGSEVEVNLADAAALAFLKAPTLGDAAMAAAKNGGEVGRIFSDLLLAQAFQQPGNT